MAQVQLYLKLVATIEADATEQQMENFLDNLIGTQQAQTRIQSYIDAYKTAIRFIVGRPAAVNANTRIVSWHVHRSRLTSTDEIEA